METTICPWCQTEIVWDEELGPEEECPHCHNELKGYRTINITLGSEEEYEDEESDHPFQDRKHSQEDDEDDEEAVGEVFWEDEGDAHLGAVRRIEAFTASGGDLLKYETGVEKLLDGQDEVPECPHCREYMVYAGKQKLVPQDGGLLAAVSIGGDRPLLPKEAELNVYVCSACFHVSRFLDESSRIAMIRAISDEEDN